jgi:hypothetical protein
MKKYFFSRYLIPIIVLSFFYSCAMDRYEVSDCKNWKGEYMGNFGGAGKCSAAGYTGDSPDDMGPGD